MALPDIIPQGKLKTTLADGGNSRILQVNPVSNTFSQEPENHIYNNLTDGVTANATGDYSVTPEYFEWQADRPCTIARMLVYIQGGGALRASGYGTIAAGLTNGIQLFVTDSSDVTKLVLTPFPVSSNAVWAAYCYDSEEHTYGAGDNAVAVRWTFARSGEPIALATGDKMRVLLQDDFSSQTFHTFHIQGVYTA